MRRPESTNVRTVATQPLSASRSPLRSRTSRSRASQSSSGCALALIRCRISRSRRPSSVRAGGAGVTASGASRSAARWVTVRFRITCVKLSCRARPGHLSGSAFLNVVGDRTSEFDVGKMKKLVSGQVRKTPQPLLPARLSASDGKVSKARLLARRQLENQMQPHRWASLRLWWQHQPRRQSAFVWRGCLSASTAT